MPRETDIVRSILEALRWRRDVLVWRQNTGAMSAESKGKRRFIRFGIPGQADLTGLLDDGTRLEIEVKRPGEKQTPNQIAYQQQIENMGGIYLLVHSLEETTAELDRLTRG